MISIILQIVAFQCLFLLLYDVFLRKETFFQYNRAYLLITSCLGMVMPFVKLESFATIIPQAYVIALPEIALGTTEDATAIVAVNGFWAYFSWQEWILLSGIVISILWFAIKYYMLLSITSKAKIEKTPLYTKVIIKNSHAAFSFFKTIFLGDAISEKEQDIIIKHELVHVRQRHSWDLMYFEILRMVFWCNPLLYAYQKRISEVHEFIADAEVTGVHKKEHYQILLSMVFKTKNLSFINPFFKQSLLKKRIIMLQKSKSKRVKQLKYLVLLPVLLSMLIYVSCEQENATEPPNTTSALKEITIKVRDINKLSESEHAMISELQVAYMNGSPENTKPLKIYLYDGKETASIQIENGVISVEKPKKDIPFAVIEEVPIFPGCEDAADPRVCFQEKIQQHIMENFSYPDEAQKLGLQGRVAIMFTINSNGEIVNIRKRGPHEILEAEAVRIMTLLPKMKPGKHKGEAVNVPFSIPITFKLSNDTN